MFLTLTRVLLWGLVFYISYQALVNWIPKPWFTVLGGLMLVTVAAVGFYNPNLQIPFEAWKIVSVPFQPLGFGFIMLLIGFSQIKEAGGIRKSRSWFLWGGFLTLLLSSMPFFSNNLAIMAQREVGNAYQNWRDYTPTVVQQPQAIILLAGETTTYFPSYGSNIPFTDRGDRIFTASRLYQDVKSDFGYSPDVIVCTPYRNINDPNYDDQEAQDIAYSLQKLGVSNSKVFVETEGVDLRTTAVNVADYLGKIGWKNKPVYLVTSPLNSRRAALTFANAGVDVITPTNYQSISKLEKRIQDGQVSLEDFLPNPNSLERTTLVVREFMGSIYYFLREWITPIELG